MNFCFLFGHAYRYRQDQTFPDRLMRRCLSCQKTQFQHTGFFYGVRWATFPSQEGIHWDMLGDDLDPVTVQATLRQHAFYRASAWGKKTRKQETTR